MLPHFIIKVLDGTFDEVISFDIHIDPFETVAGSSYMELPKKSAARQAVINPDNEEDNECFKWAITIAEYPSKKNPQRVNKRVKEASKNFNWEGIDFSTPLDKIHIFEKNNPE